jgi:hypothetical protein
MLRLFIPLLFVTLATPCLAADPCDELPAPSVKLKRLDERETLNTRYGYRTLTNLGQKLARPGNTVLGLTRGNAIVKFETSLPSIVDASGRWECASPQITVSLGFKPMTVYVAREFPAGSCAYEEIYRHEQRHVKTYQDHLDGLEKTVQETLNRRFATKGPWHGPVGETAVRLQQELDERWLPYLQREIGRVEEAQAQIDTPEEYARIADSCNGEIKQRTGRVAAR